MLRNSFEKEYKKDIAKFGNSRKGATFATAIKKTRHRFSRLEKQTFKHNSGRVEKRSKLLRKI